MTTEGTMFDSLKLVFTLEQMASRSGDQDA